jgi:sugar phosphate isomerase/epimerase
MIVTLHGLSTMHCNCETEIRLAKDTGYEAWEIVEAKLVRYLDQGYDPARLVKLMKKHKIKPVTINALKWIERYRKKERAQLMQECLRLCKAAKALKCKTIQLVPFCDTIDSMSNTRMMKILTDNVREIADIGKAHGVRFQLEPIAWGRFHSLHQSLDLIDRVGRDNVRMVVDFWHLWAGEETTPEDVAVLDKKMIYSIHFCDGKRIPKRGKWSEEGCRGFLPGEGDIPIKDWVAAVRETGFDGPWSSELYSPKHWEWDLHEVALKCRELMIKYTK